MGVGTHFINNCFSEHDMPLGLFEDIEDQHEEHKEDPPLEFLEEVDYTEDEAEEDSEQVVGAADDFMDY